jgi:hypothetical protein
MRDDNYDKAMALLDAAADRTLRPRLLEQLEALVARRHWGLAESADYEAKLGFLALDPPSCLLEIDERPILRTVVGTAATLNDALEAVGRDGRVFIAAASSRLTAALHDQSIPVFAGSAAADQQRDLIGPAALVIRRYLAERSRDSVVGFVRRRFFKADLDEEAAGRIAHPEDVLVSVEVDDDPQPDVRQLLVRAAELLARVDAGYKELRSGRIEARPDAPALFVLGRELAPVMALPPEGGYERGFLERPTAVVDTEHPMFRRFRQAFASTPELAAYCLAKSLLLTEDVLLDRDAELCRHATAQLRLIT